MALPSSAPRPERRRDTTADCACPQGRVFPSHPVVREMLRALGVETCPSCHQATRIAGRGRWVERP